jgi:acyl-coenzyme A synthetase/AMP-(fatty) acid ligase
VFIAAARDLGEVRPLWSRQCAGLPGGDHHLVAGVHAQLAHGAARRHSRPAVHLGTTGSTNTPKTVPVPIVALASFQAYLEFGLDVRADDVFWNAADPGWARGLYYAILGPLAAGDAAPQAAQVGRRNRRGTTPARIRCRAAGPGSS